jgi:hypothetical protein
MKYWLKLIITWKTAHVPNALVTLGEYTEKQNVDCVYWFPLDRFAINYKKLKNSSNFPKQRTKEIERVQELLLFHPDQHNIRLSNTL